MFHRLPHHHVPRGTLARLRHGKVPKQRRLFLSGAQGLSMLPSAKGPPSCRRNTIHSTTMNMSHERYGKKCSMRQTWSNKSSEADRPSSVPITPRKSLNTPLPSACLVSVCSTCYPPCKSGAQAWFVANTAATPAAGSMLSYANHALALTLAAATMQWRKQNASHSNSLPQMKG